jgi:parvin
MAVANRSKSPIPTTPKRDDKEESIWDKLGTLGRKKKIKEGMFFLIVLDIFN